MREWEKATTRMVLLDGGELINEPNNEDFSIGTVDYHDDEDDVVMAAEEEVEVDVAIDSGCVCHVVKPGDVPRGVAIKKPSSGRRRNLVAANGSDMENYGDAEVEMVEEDGHVISSTLTVTDVTRALHSTSQVCDTESGACPEGHEVLYTKGCATVVPEGALSRFLGSVRQVARYPRRGGLYVARMKLRAPRARPQRRPDPKKPSAPGFGRPGAKR